VKEPLHNAKYYTWQPAERRERTQWRQRIPFRTPQQFVSALRGLFVDEPLNYWLIGTEGDDPALHIKYGTTSKGVQHHVIVRLTWPEARRLDTYLKRRFTTQSLSTIVGNADTTGEAR
jgi:hypothetical protein